MMLSERPPRVRLVNLCIKYRDLYSEGQWRTDLTKLLVELQGLEDKIHTVLEEINE